MDNSKNIKEGSLDIMMESGFDVVDHKKCNRQDYTDVMAAKHEIEKLDEVYREIVQLRFFAELPLRDIAQMIGESKNNVAVKLHRALKKLKINLN